MKKAELAGSELVPGGWLLSSSLTSKSWDKLAGWEEVGAKLPVQTH